MVCSHCCIIVISIQTIDLPLMPVDRGIIMLDESSSIKTETQYSMKVIALSNFYWRFEFCFLSGKGINFTRKKTQPDHKYICGFKPSAGNLLGFLVGTQYLPCVPMLISNSATWLSTKCQMTIQSWSHLLIKTWQLVWWDMVRFAVGAHTVRTKSPTNRQNAS